jgi:hypothetical protein
MKAIQVIYQKPLANDLGVISEQLSPYASLLALSRIVVPSRKEICCEHDPIVILRKTFVSNVDRIPMLRNCCERRNKTVVSWNDPATPCINLLLCCDNFALPAFAVKR